MHFEIKFSGHENIRSLHQKTIEITTESELTPDGDCIVGVNASCGCKDIPQEIKDKLKDPNTKAKFSIIVNDQVFSVGGIGNPALVFSHPEDIVLRKSTFTCPRTLAVQCTEASDSIPRDMIEQLQNPSTKGIFSIDID